jgi:hypothetical protein
MNRRIPLLLLLAAVVVPAAEAQSLRGSRASVERIYRQAQIHDLHFYETSAGVHRAVERGTFVRLTGNRDYETANVSYPFVLPATETFVVRLAAQYRAACGERLVVTSAVRPRSFRLANASDRSVHPTGMAVDLRRPSNPRCLSWLRSTLLALDGRGVIEAVEERRPPHFHVAVFPTPYTRYVAGMGASPKVAAAERNASQAQEVVMASNRTYQVRRGDSLWTIARRNNVTVDAIQSANALSSTRIIAGQVLVIPEAR